MTPSPAFDVARVRERFPALNRTVDGRQPVYLDNPGGTQVSAAVVEAMGRYLVEMNSNAHGGFRTSHLTDATVTAAREAMADFLNAPSPREIVFGPNMTSLTFHVSRAIGRTLAAGDEVIVTRMDHDANIAPWLWLAEDRDLTVRWADFDPETGRLDYAQLADQVTDRTRLIACVYASNALGTINDAARVAALAREAGALSYVDSVQYAPHGPIDVAALGVDFLVCSAYKFFGPHVGVLYGRTEHLERLPAYKVRPSPTTAPERWETGTPNFEGLAGVAAAVDYLAWIGETFGAPFADLAAGYEGRRAVLKRAMHAIRAYERNLSRALLDGLAALDGVTVFGIDEIDALGERVPTVIFDVAGKHPADVAAALGAEEIYVWDGNYYAQAVMERLGFEGKGGLVRVGPVHYNTLDEIDRFLAALKRIVTA
jgi:cysteine desulfurase family protein (TIGR01976 family)